MRYKVGDKVKIRKDLILDTLYSTENESFPNMSFCGNMIDYIGKTARIINVKKDNGCYHINLTGTDYWWSIGMFEEQLYDGCLVRLKNGRLCVYRNNTFYGKDGFKRQMRCYDKETLKHKKVDELSIIEVYGEGDLNDIFSMKGREILKIFPQ